jgi:Ni/Fe-hydrogenase subunit HybB-like protein
MDEQYKITADAQAPVIEPGYTFGSVTDKISAIVLTRPASNGWFLGFGVAFLMTMMMLYAIGYLVLKGIGIWGVTIPIGWGFAIVNFVWWIGIGHAGTLISAILLLLRQSWRNSINRFAEAMTLFAVACAGIFPAIHVGRPWLAYWLFPYPSTMGVWPQFRSPLMWDVFAVSTYATISALFWFIGLVPDMATLRDRAHASRHQNNLRHALAGLARIGAPLAPLRDSLSAARRIGHAASALRSHRREL